MNPRLQVQVMLKILLSSTVANNSSAMIDEGNIILINNDIGIVKQETSMSEPAPVRHPGQPPHEVVFALPLRDDGKVWSGRATFTASKPIEVEVPHIYTPRENIESVFMANLIMQFYQVTKLLPFPISENWWIYQLK